MLTIKYIKVNFFYIAFLYKGEKKPHLKKLKKEWSRKRERKVKGCALFLLGKSENPTTYIIAH